MKAHVTGPPTLGELRQALTAVFVGNPLFSPAEQLQLNHATYESDELATLTQQLHRLRYEAVRRQRVADLRQQVAAMSESVYPDAATQFDESIGRAAATACQRRAFPICYALWQLHSAGVRVHRLLQPWPDSTWMPPPPSPAAPTTRLTRLTIGRPPAFSQLSPFHTLTC